MDETNITIPEDWPPTFHGEIEALLADALDAEDDDIIDLCIDALAGEGLALERVYVLIQIGKRTGDGVELRETR